MRTPEPLRQIAADVLAGVPRRAKVRTLLGYFGLLRRREAGLVAIRAELTALGISTIPEFETAGFDDQVRFLPIGDESDCQADDKPLSGLYSLTPISSSGAGVRLRVLLATFDAYERFVDGIVAGRKGRVFQHGQNPRRQDRDEFPFFVTVEVAEDETEKLISWLDEATRLEGSEEIDASAVASWVEAASAHIAGQASTLSDAVDGLAFDQLRLHVSDLHEAMTAEVRRQATELRGAVERKVDEVRFEAIQQLAKKLNDEEAMKVIQEFDQEMRQKLEQKDLELRESYNEISLLTSQVADLEEKLSEQDTYDPSDAYPTMSATVQLFADITAGSPVVVADSALKSAQRSASPKRREVLQLLLCLREFAVLVFGPNPQKVRTEEWFGARGYDWAKGDSESTVNKYGHERVIKFDGVEVQLEEHVTLFPGTPNCVSVYWWRDEKGKRVVLGYVGPHLRTTSW